MPFCSIRICIFHVLLFLCVASFSIQVEARVVTGHWDFSSSDLSATIGSPIVAQGSTNHSFGLATIDGEPTEVLIAPALAGSADRYRMIPGATANGGGSRVNDWTVILDISFASTGSPAYHSLINTEANNTTDQTIFRRSSGGGANGAIDMGPDAQAAPSGAVPNNTWLRLILVRDFTNGDHRVYVDGVEVGSNNSAPSLDSTGGAIRTSELFFLADDSGDTGDCQVACVQFRDYAMDDSEAQQFGAISPDGIPTTVASAPPAIVEVASVGPWVEYTGDNTAIVRWHTASAQPSILQYGKASVSENRVENLVLKTVHALTMTGLQRDTEYNYTIGGNPGSGETVSQEYLIETNLNYTLPDIPNLPSPYPNDSVALMYQAAVQHILATTSLNNGYCLVLGSNNGQLVYELAKASQLHVIGVDTDPVRVNAARANLSQAGIYGPRATIQLISDYNSLPIRKHFANLIVSDSIISDGVMLGDATEVNRVLRPGGGKIFFGQPSGASNPPNQVALEAWFTNGGLTYSVNNDANGLWAESIRSSLAGIGEWTHQYGNVANSSASEDQLEGATATGDFEVQWVGRPGADATMDRNPRKPSPLSANGRIYLQGFKRIIALDSYNGAILWHLSIPNLIRTNIPRDSSNWCCDDDYVYVAMKDHCWKIDGLTGELITTFNVSTSGPQSSFDWGHIGSNGTRLFGSNVVKDSSYDDYWGGENWFDGRSGYGTHKVCSDDLFANDKATGNRLWTYDNNSKILNTTITVGGGRVYFVECRNATVTSSGQGRVSLDQLWQDQYLVALNETTGAVVYQQPINTADGIVTFYLSYTNNPSESLVLVSSDTNYDIYAYNATNGSLNWSQSHSWPTTHHGGHMQHPVLMGGIVYQDPRSYRMSDGVQIDSDLGPRSGCPTRVGAANVIIFRGGSRNMAVWDKTAKTYSQWPKLRPGCWLSTIPAQGMILSPEGGGGCSCGQWFQTSMGFSMNEGSLFGSRPAVQSRKEKGQPKVEINPKVERYPELFPNSRH